MKHLAAAILLACAISAVSNRLWAQSENVALRALVDRFYPAERLNPGSASERFACYQVLEATPLGEPALVIAAYTDRSAGAIRVLRRNASGAFEVAGDNPAGWVLPGSDCRIRLEDLDFDGRQEALVYFLGLRASSGWILGWDGTTLVNLTPTRSEGARQSSLLLGPTVYDLEHNGSLRIVALREVERPGPGEQPRNPAFVYRLGPSGLQMEKGILAVMGFRADVDPRGNLRAFRLTQDSVPPWTLKVINGDRSGRNRVTGATLQLNNREVLGPREINEGTEFVTTVLPSLSTENHLTATLTGPDEAFIIVLIEDSTKR
jgi:hypothetical protein